MDDDGCRLCRADVEGLPVAVAEDLAGDLIAGLRSSGGRDFDEMGLGEREAVGAGEEVSSDGLQVSVLQEAAGLEFRGVAGVGGDVVRLWHQLWAFLTAA